MKKEKVKKFTLIFIGIMILSGILLMYSGNDALVLATERKEGILTAEQVKVSFESVGGRLIKEGVQEAQQVKKGDVLVVLDSSDVDLSIAQMEAQIAQLDAQIKSATGGVAISYAQANTDEQQSFRQIDQQKAAVSAAEATYANSQVNYNRMTGLLASGAVAQQEVDNAQLAMDVAAASLSQQRENQAKLLAGTSYSDNTDALNLPTIAIQRQTAANKLNDVEALVQQKKSMEAQLKNLQLNKERLTLRAPEDGKILKILAKEGEIVAPNTPVILMETTRCYFDVYISEENLGDYKEGDNISVETVATGQKLEGNIRILTKAPGFADLKMTREKGQSDLTAFQMRIYLEPQEKIVPGMTMGVNLK